MIDHVQGNKLSTMANLDQTIERPKLKLTGTVNVPTTIDKEVELPYFAKGGTHVFYKVLSPETVLVVGTYDFSTSAEVGKVVYNLQQLNKATECTEQEFNEAFETVKSKINQL